jgi:hypothetical protein
MQMLYGNYDVREQTSVALLPTYKGMTRGNGEEQMTVRPVFNAFSGDAGAQSFVLVTYAVPPDWDCHGCVPIIGMAVFSQKHSKWTMDAFNRTVTAAGSWGKPPLEIELVQIGPSRHAVKLEDLGGGQGENTRMLALLIPWDDTVKIGLRRIIFDGYACANVGDPPCYENQRTVKFIPNGKAEYYDLELELTGTDLAGGNGTPLRAQEVHGLEILKFENGKYVQVSRQGDLTSADSHVTELEWSK